MSYTNETTYYGLPLPSGSDKSTFTDNNTAFEAVDAALHTASEGAAQAALNITALTGRVGDCETNITNLNTDLGLEKAKIVNLQNKETLQDGEIRDVRSDCEDMICAYNEAAATSTHAYSAGDYFIYNDVLYVATDSIAVGDAIVPDTNCETRNVTSELKSQASDIDQLNSDLAKCRSNEFYSITRVNSEVVTGYNTESAFTVSEDGYYSFKVSNLSAAEMTLIIALKNSYDEILYTEYSTGQGQYASIQSPYFYLHAGTYALLLNGERATVLTKVM